MNTRIHRPVNSTSKKLSSREKPANSTSKKRISPDKLDDLLDSMRGRQTMDDLKLRLEARALAIGAYGNRDRWEKDPELRIIRNLMFHAAGG